MRRLLATLLMLCLGISIPAAVSPMRVCFLKGEVLMTGFPTCGETSTHKKKCCNDCGATGKGDSCCQDIKKLPDAERPAGPLLLPPLSICKISEREILPPCPVVEITGGFMPTAPIRGPDSPGSRRARLGIWNI